jgi:hypothetical protein
MTPQISTMRPAVSLSSSLICAASMPICGPREERITAASRQLMAEVNAFRAGQENTKAAYLAAEEAAKAVDAEIASAS